MKRLIAFLMCYLPVFFAISQQLWIPGGTPSGIGTSSNTSICLGTNNNTPLGKLDIRHVGGQLSLTGGTIPAGLWTTNTGILYLADWYGAKGLKIDLATGNVGLGTGENIAYKLEVHTNNAGNLRMTSHNATPNLPAIDVLDIVHGTEFVLSPSAGKVDLFIFSSHPLALGTANTERMRIQPNGNVGIGTTNPDAKLTVKGIIHTEEVRVDMSVPGPDYVFEQDYDLMSLSEIETFVKENKHLPEVPSAVDVEANGLNLKEMNLLLLKKVEELTLHLIEMEKKIETQNKQK
jgi:hypothetical protein